MRIIDADALNAVIVHRHDFFRGCTAAPEKARRDELLQVMCDINEQPTIDAIPVEWLRPQMKNNPNDIETAYDDICLSELIQKWQKEQEAQK